MADLFLDRSLGRSVVASSLAKAGALIRIHDEWFAADEDDAVWIRSVTERGWLILTKDERLRSRHGAMRAILDAGARVFTLGAESLRGEEMAEVFVLHHLAMAGIAASLSGPFLYSVSRAGLRRIHPPAA